MGSIDIEPEHEADWIVMRLGSANAVGPRFLDAMEDVLDRLEMERGREKPRPMLLTGEGTAFSAGLDLLNVIALNRDDFESFLNRFHQIFFRLARLERPLIAVVNGHAVAGGMVLLMACDWKLGARTLPGSDRPYKLGLRESVLGVPLPPIGIGLLELAVPSLSHRLELALCGDLIDPEKALLYGVLNQLADTDQLREAGLEVATRWSRSTSLTGALLKRDIKTQKLESFRTPDYSDFLDAWFSPESQDRLTAAVEDLEQRKRSSSPKDTRKT